jgi:serine/threonine-protein phosphatase 5
LSDFEIVAKRRPNDVDAKKKFVECNKIVKKIAFEKAISIDKPEKTLAQMYQQIESISIEDDYDGPKLENETTVTLDFMKQLMQWYKDQKKLHKKYAYKVNSNAPPTRIPFSSPAEFIFRSSTISTHI